ncbi:unnamed protein product [Didymodactylos carnosus]|uniref:WH1 domain-containing protein n=1 Tax=Didymodactylos carnosus TaxID=1234261 RepID=A0A814K4Q0_9BILA|nr:unnamed protein product [Didymodactylos carnosus]CAF3814507.1 unnamed protein product [Didymodactylos carnosus]
MPSTTGVAQILSSDKPDLSGVLCFVKDYDKRAYYFRLYDLKNSTVLIKFINEDEAEFFVNHFQTKQLDREKKSYQQHSTTSLNRNTNTKTDVFNIGRDTPRSVPPIKSKPDPPPPPPPPREHKKSVSTSSAKSIPLLDTIQQVAKKLQPESSSSDKQPTNQNSATGSPTDKRTRYDAMIARTLKFLTNRTKTIEYEVRRRNR